MPTIAESTPKPDRTVSVVGEEIKTAERNLVAHIKKEQHRLFLLQQEFGSLIK